MKDSLILIGTAILLAVIGWALWYFAGREGFGMFSSLALLLLLADNFRLRRKLRKL